jgi:transposase
MPSHLFWFNDEQWAKIEPHLPTNQPGPERKDDRLILSGIMHVLKVGCRWVDCPREYGPHKTIYNRFARWSERGIWQKIFEAVAAPSKTPEQAALDSSHGRCHVVESLMRVRRVSQLKSCGGDDFAPRPHG